MSDGGCICSRLDEKHSLLFGDSILYALVKKYETMYAPDTQRNGIGLAFWNVPGVHVDDVSSLSALYQSVLWDCGA